MLLPQVKFVWFAGASLLGEIVRRDGWSVACWCCCSLEARHGTCDSSRDGAWTPGLSLGRVSFQACAGLPVASDAWPWMNEWNLEREPTQVRCWSWLAVGGLHLWLLGLCCIWHSGSHVIPNPSAWWHVQVGRFVPNPVMIDTFGWPSTLIWQLELLDLLSTLIWQVELLDLLSTLIRMKLARFLLGRHLLLRPFSE